ncbi:MAG: ribosome hibernation-promoting factor, HPF/YfiA family [bacterium]
MEFQFVGQNIDLTQSLKDYAKKRASKLEKYVSGGPDQIIQTRIKLNVQAERQIADIQVNADGKFFEGRATSPDLYASIDQAVDKLGRQMRKFHDQQTSHRKKNNRGPEHRMASKIFELEDEEEDGDTKIIRRKTFTAKPMTAEEAVLQMDTLDYNFFVFTNQVTDDINVVYEREDGSYGLIETHS